MAKMKQESRERVEIQEIQTQEVTFHIVGRTPLICHRFPFKAWQELVLPARKENRAALEQTLKHVPVEEYRESFYRNKDAKQPTLFHLPNGMFAGALTQTGVDVPGAARATLERLTRVKDVNICLYGTPQIFCSMVRNSGMTRTPDVRTRPIFPQWCCQVTIGYVRPQLTEKNIINLMGAAGIINGIGDWRGEKGGPYGAFKIVPASDREFQSIQKQARKVQQAAFESPAYYDDDTEQLLTWFDEELKRREQDGTAGRRRNRGSGGNGAPKTKRTHIVNGPEHDEQYVGVAS